MLDDSNKTLEVLLPLLVCDDCCCDVAEDVRTAGLNGIQVTAKRQEALKLEKHRRTVKHSLLLLKEVLDDFILALGMVEIDKEAPVDQPRPVLQSHQMRSRHLQCGAHQSHKVLNSGTQQWV